MFRLVGYTVAAVALAALIVIAGAPPAAIAAPPTKADCGSFTDVFERVKCRHDAVADQMEYTADTAFAPGTGLHGRAEPGRIKHLVNARARGQRAKGQTTTAVLKKLAKAEVRGNRKAGHLVPLSGFDDTDGDGICDFEQGDNSAQCAAIELDEFGELQACNPEKKNKGKGKPGSGKFEGLECDLFFDPENAADTAEAADMEQAAQEMEEAFGAVEDDLIEMNGHLDAVNASLSAGPASLRAAAAGGCVIPNFGSAANDAAIALRALTVGSRWVASITAKAAGQTIVLFGAGGNVLGSVSFLDAAAAAIEVSYIIADEIAIDQSNQVQAATAACVADVARQVGDLATQVAALQVAMTVQHGEIQTNDNANTAALQARLNEVEAELARLLTTPQGRREDFPSP